MAAVISLRLFLSIGKKKRAKNGNKPTMLAGALLDAEAKIGEILGKIPKQPTETDHAGRFGGSKPILPKGITHKQSSAFQTLAENKDIIEQVKAEAEAEDDLPTRTEVLRRVAEKRGEIKISIMQSLLGNKKVIHKIY